MNACKPIGHRACRKEVHPPKTGTTGRIISALAPPKVSARSACNHSPDVALSLELRSLRASAGDQNAPLRLADGRSLLTTFQCIRERSCMHQLAGVTHPGSAFRLQATGVPHKLMPHIADFYDNPPVWIELQGGYFDGKRMLIPEDRGIWVMPIPLDVAACWLNEPPDPRYPPTMPTQVYQYTGHIHDDGTRIFKAA